jgi:hypothetical protein
MFAMKISKRKESGMDRLDNKDIGTIWTRHYPMRIYSEISRSLCTSLAMILHLRAQLTSLEHLLATANIPRSEFDTVIVAVFHRSVFSSSL